MALLWFDGFELDRTADSLALNYNQPTNWPASIPATGGRFGGFSLKSIVSTETTASTRPLPFTAPSTDRQVYVGIAVKASSPGNSDLFGMIGGVIAFTSWVVRSVDNGDGTWSATLIEGESDTVLSTSEPIINGSWIYFEVAVLSKDSGAWSWRLNGSDIGSGVGDFLNLGVPQSRFAMVWPSLAVGSVEYDDVYVTEDGFLGSEFTVEGLQVNGDVSIEWAPSVGGPSFEMIDDPGDSDGDATYVQTSVDGDTDKYDLQPLGWIQGAIHAIRWQLDARNDIGQNFEVTPEYVVAGQSAQGVTQTIIDQAYQRLAEILTTNPVDATIWEKGDFGDLQVGMTKGTPVGVTALEILDEDQVIGYMETADPDEWFDLYDENQVVGELDTKVTNSQLALFDEAQVEGEFDLVVI